MSWTANPSPRSTNRPPQWVIQAALRRDRFTCQTCGEAGREVDHIDRLGAHSLTNLQTLCSSCHMRKTVAESQKAQKEIRERNYRPRQKTALEKWRDTQNQQPSINENGEPGSP